MKKLLSLLTCIISRLKIIILILLVIVLFGCIMPNVAVLIRMSKRRMQKKTTVKLSVTQKMHIICQHTMLTQIM